jgi:hypothetical protein
VSQNACIGSIKAQSSDSSIFAEGMFLAQYKVLRENGHSPSEAFNETVEEATQSLFPLIGANGFVLCSLPLPPQL